MGIALWWGSSAEAAYGDPSGHSPGMVAVTGPGYSVLLSGSSQDETGMRRFEKALGEAEPVRSYNDRLHLLRLASSYLTGGVLGGVRALFQHGWDIPSYLAVPVVLMQILGQASLSWQLPLLALCPSSMAALGVWTWLGALLVASLWLGAAQAGLIGRRFAL